MRENWKEFEKKRL